jgi:hypothetical protein
MVGRNASRVRQNRATARKRGLLEWGTGAMTEQEAQALAARLTRIWDADASYIDTGRAGYFGFQLQLQPHIKLKYLHSPKSDVLRLEDNSYGPKELWLTFSSGVKVECLIADRNAYVSHPVHQPQIIEALSRFDAQYRDFFRRCCFLMVRCSPNGSPGFR